MCSGAGYGAAFSAVFGALDVFSTHSAGEERLAANAEEITLAKKEYQAMLGQGYKPEELTEYTKRISEAQAAQTRIIKENADANLKAGAGAAGMIAGTAIGAGVGSLLGPVGTMIGGMIGGMAGEKVGTWVAEKKIEYDVGKPAAPKSDYFSTDKKTSEA